MADLVTHGCTVLLPGALVRSRWLPVAVVGTMLPDLLGRAVPLALERLYAAGLPIPDELLWPWSAVHEPVGWLLVGAIAACAFVEAERDRALLALWGGAALHSAVDLLQDHHGVGYQLLAPFSTRSFELGWIGSEATAAFALPLAALTAVAWAPALAGREGRAWAAVPAAALVGGLAIACFGWTR